MVIYITQLTFSPTIPDWLLWKNSSKSQFLYWHSLLYLAQDNHMQYSYQSFKSFSIINLLWEFKSDSILLQCFCRQWTEIRCHNSHQYQYSIGEPSTLFHEWFAISSLAINPISLFSHDHHLQSINLILNCKCLLNNCFALHFQSSGMPSMLGLYMSIQIVN